MPCSYCKKSLLVALDYSRQLYFIDDDDDENKLWQRVKSQMDWVMLRACQQFQSLIYIYDGLFHQEKYNSDRQRRDK